MIAPRTSTAVLLLASLAACGDAPAPRVPVPPTPPAAQSGSAPNQPAASADPLRSVADAVAGAAAQAEQVKSDASKVDPSKWRTSTSADDATAVEVAGLRAPKPASWVWTKPSMQFRTLQYAVAGEGDSTKAAELIISVFMAGDGGPLDANITRWKGQFRVGDAAPEPKLSDKEIGPLKVKFVELEGDYMAMGAPAPRKDFLQLGAIVEAPGRNVFFRLIGPKETVESNRADFMKMIDGLMPAD
jgi:hypothetical protein